MKDFRVPVQVCADYSVVLRPTKESLRFIVMEAMGINTSHHSDAKMSYEQFLNFNSFLHFNNGTPDDYIWFCVRLFDPKLEGFTSVGQCERVIDLLFDNQNESGETTRPPKVNMPDNIVKRVEIRSQAENASSIAGDAADETLMSEVCDGKESGDEEDSIQSANNAAAGSKKKGAGSSSSDGENEKKSKEGSDDDADKPD